MKKYMRIIQIFLVVLILISMFTVAFADYQPTEFKSKIETDNGTNNIKSTGGRVVGIIQVVGTIAAVGMLIVLGIKYMMGSAEERAEYKKTLFPYFIGAVLIFAAGSLTQMIYSWAIKL